MSLKTNPSLFHTIPNKSCQTNNDPPHQNKQNDPSPSRAKSQKQIWNKAKQINKNNNTNQNPKKIWEFWK